MFLAFVMSKIFFSFEEKLKKHFKRSKGKNTRLFCSERFETLQWNQEECPDISIQCEHDLELNRKVPIFFPSLQSGLGNNFHILHNNQVSQLNNSRKHANFPYLPPRISNRTSSEISIIYQCLKIKRVQGWRSGESTRLPPMWPGFDSRTRRHMWVEFVGSLLCTERFSPGTSVSPLLKNQHLIWFTFIVNFSLQCPQLALQR